MASIAPDNPIVATPISGVSHHPPKTEAQFAQNQVAETARTHMLAAEASHWRHLYESVLANTPDLGYVFDLNHRFTFANEALLKMWGKSWDEAIGKNCLELGYPAWHAAMHDREIEQVIVTRQPIRGDVAFNGTYGRRIYDYIFFPVIGANGEVEAVAGTTRDVTDRKRAQVLSECQRQTLQSLAEGAPLDFVLSNMLEKVERHCGDDMLCSILLLDETGTRFERSIGPSLPGQYNQAVAGVEVASLIGTCCYAVTDRAPSMAPDVFADPKWKRFAELIGPYGLRATWSTPIFGSDGRVLGTFANFYRTPCDPRPQEKELVEIVTQTAANAIERKTAEALGKRSETLLVEQKRLLELIATGCQMEQCLTELTAAVPRLVPNASAAVMLADEARRKIVRAFGVEMRASFAKGVYGEKICEAAIGPCGAAMSKGEPVTSSDVASDVRWSPEFRALCAAHGIAAVHSTPVTTTSGNIAAAFPLFFAEPHEPTKWERGIGEFGAHIAGIAIDRELATNALNETQRRMATDLADSMRLQSISSELSRKDDPQALYEKVLDAAMAIMGSSIGTIQMLYPERGTGGELLLLAHRGLDPQSVKFWTWVSADSGCTCGAALRTCRRSMVPDMMNCDWMAGTDDQEAYRKAGIRAGQTTPLISRNGKLLGMLSTHWKYIHQPSERDFRMLDIVARQAADLIERRLAEDLQKQTEDALRSTEKFAAAGRMAATIAHEINNPLEAVMNLWYLLNQENLSPAGRERLGTMGDELERVSHITRQTLEFYRQGTNATAVNIADPIKAAVSLFARRAELSGTVIETKFRTRATIYGFSGELRQLFANLIGNAIEAGSKTIKIRVSQADAGSAAGRPGVYVLVADNGAGIPDGTNSSLFQPFFTTKAEKGTGLGLWVSKGIVQKHEGWIRVRSSVTPGHRGTTFCMFLPTVEEQQVAAD
ncbi:MAG TPA: GAF domain-containing protein [Acidobacteriaceae bacterium]|nr:GAF domain-containing protein [Acidobacteriaceae bacterium]